MGRWFSQKMEEANIWKSPKSNQPHKNKFHVSPAKTYFIKWESILQNSKYPALHLHVSVCFEERGILQFSRQILETFNVFFLGVYENCENDEAFDLIVATLKLV